MGEEEGGDALAILVIKERSSRMFAATVVPRRSAGEYAAKRVVSFIKGTGCNHIRAGVRPNNEPAVVDLVERLGKARWGSALSAARGALGSFVLASLR